MTLIVLPCSIVSHEEENSSDQKFYKNHRNVASNLGDLIPGTGGIRKTRLKSATKGTSGGFRVCYFDNPKTEELFLILIYQKNVQENISSKEKKTLKEIANIIKAQK